MNCRSFLDYRNDGLALWILQQLCNLRILKCSFIFLFHAQAGAFRLLPVLASCLRQGTIRKQVLQWRCGRPDDDMAVESVGDAGLIRVGTLDDTWRNKWGCFDGSQNNASPSIMALTTFCRDSRGFHGFAGTFQNLQLACGLLFWKKYKAQISTWQCPSISSLNTSVRGLEVRSDSCQTVEQSTGLLTSNHLPIRFVDLLLHESRNKRFGWW